MPKNHRIVRALACAFVIAASLRAVHAGPGPVAGAIGVEMPAAGDDGGAGLAAAAAIRLAAGPRRVAVRDSSRGGFLNPHRDEGSDNDVDLAAAPRIVAGFAAAPRIVAVVGGLRRNVGDADAAAAEAHRIPALVLARWSRTPGGANAFCLCVSPPRLVAAARATARAPFGPRLLVVLIGEAGLLPSLWPGRFDGTTIVRAGDSADVFERARRLAAGVDAVLVLADERPPALWRSTAFRRGFTAEYVRRLEHRDFLVAPAGARRGDVLVLREAALDGPARRAFVQRFHAAQGFMPSPEAARAYAAAQILAAAGPDRAAVRRALRTRSFDTVLGRVRFDADGYRTGARFTASAP
jgi:Periplasmic binding protein